MGNLTISVNEDTLRKARIRALEQGTSVNAVLKRFLEAYAGTNEAHRAAARDLLALSRASDARSGGRRWRRDELHDRR